LMGAVISTRIYRPQVLFQVDNDHIYRSHRTILQVTLYLSHMFLEEKHYKYINTNSEQKLSTFLKLPPNKKTDDLYEL